MDKLEVFETTPDEMEYSSMFNGIVYFHVFKGKREEKCKRCILNDLYYTDCIVAPCQCTERKDGKEGYYTNEK